MKHCAVKDCSVSSMSKQTLLNSTAEKFSSFACSSFPWRGFEGCVVILQRRRGRLPRTEYQHVHSACGPSSMAWQPPPGPCPGSRSCRQLDTQTWEYQCWKYMIARQTGILASGEAYSQCRNLLQTDDTSTWRASGVFADHDQASASFRKHAPIPVLSSLIPSTPARSPNSLFLTRSIPPTSIRSLPPFHFLSHRPILSPSVLPASRSNQSPLPIISPDFLRTPVFSGRHAHDPCEAPATRTLNPP
jgi:hypothetical protein